MIMAQYVITHRTGGYTISITTTVLMYILTEVTGIITCRDTDMPQGLTTGQSQNQTTHRQRDQILSQIEAHLQVLQKVTEAEAEGDK